MKKTVFTALTALVFVLTMAACSAGRAPAEDPQKYVIGTSSYNNGAPELLGDMDTAGGMYAYDMVEYGEAVSEPAAAPEAAAEAPDISVTDPNRKLIRTASISAETTDFDNSIAKLEAMCLNYGGFVESSSVNGTSITARGKQYRSANYSFRIPSLRYNEFLNSMGTIGNVINKSQNSQDITDTYYDMESRLKILEMRRDRLMGLLETETNSRSIIEFETSLSETLYEIEKMTGSLKKYDSLVEYSTISVYLEEVERYTEIQPYEPAPETFWERVSSAFADSAYAIGEFFTGLAVFVIGNILYLLLYGAIITVIVLVTKKIIKRPKKTEPIVKEDVKADRQDVQTDKKENEE